MLLIITVEVDHSSIAQKSNLYRYLCAFRSQGHRWAAVNPVPFSQKEDNSRFSINMPYLKSFNKPIWAHILRSGVRVL